jgi:signal peptidase I
MRRAMKKVGWKLFAGILTAIFGTVMALVFTCAFGVTKIQGDTMKPTLLNNRLAVLYKWAYLFNEPKEGDIVMFDCDVYSEDGEGSLLAKRVIAMEGDSVEIKDGMVYKNGQPYDKYAVKNVYLDPMTKIVVQKDSVFVLSDNRDAILDSRDQAVGQLKITELKGKICFK